MQRENITANSGKNQNLLVESSLRQDNDLNQLRKSKTGGADMLRAMRKHAKFFYVFFLL